MQQSTLYVSPPLHYLASHSSIHSAMPLPNVGQDRSSPQGRHGENNGTELENISE